MACSNSSDNYSGRNCPHYRKEKEMKEKDLILTSIILFILVLILTIVIVKPKQKNFSKHIQLIMFKKELTRQPYTIQDMAQVLI